MNTCRSKRSDGAKAGDWLQLASAPTFAVMALATAVMDSDPTHMLCQAMGHGPLSLDGMVFMYLLMSIFHAGPWWRLVVSGACKRIRAERGHASNPVTGGSR